MQGLYRSATEDSFVSDETIHREQLRRHPSPEPKFVTPIPQPKGFEYWSARMQDRQRIYMETAENPNSVEIEFENDTLLNFMSDLHVGGAETDYARIDEELKAIKETPNSFLVLVGDEIDAFFFSPAVYDAPEQVQQQYEYLMAMSEYMRGKLLIGVAGNHNLWIKKSGVNPYTHFTEKSGAYFMHGLGYLTARVGGQEYKISLNHKFRGHSMYNNTHSEMRAERMDGGAEGSHAVIGGHYHTKGIAQQTVQGFSNSARKVVYMSLGTYKPSDEYTKTQGFPRRSPESMYGCSLVLRKDKWQMKPYYDILEAHDDFIEYQIRNGVAGE